jgi:hypothetical protein
MSPRQQRITAREVWERYQAAPRILTPEYIRSIPWEDLGPCPGQDFVRALMIASDVETATYDVFFLQELSSTASHRDPIINAFMKRWVEEELTHGELLRKLLRLWGYDHKYVTPEVGRQTLVARRIVQVWGTAFGEQFKFIHMIWGGINELTARETYRRLRNSTTDGVVRLLLGAIIKEESLHANFYLGIAEARTHSPAARFLCRLAFRRWRPVGAWNKTDAEMRPVLQLFEGAHIRDFDRNVTREFERRFPVFAGSGLTARLESLIRASRLTACGLNRTPQVQASTPF